MAFHFKVGLKLHSTNLSLITESIKYKEEGFVDYIELYTIPGTYQNTIDSWMKLDVPYVIHAPHSLHGVNLAQVDKWETNLRCFNEAIKFADDLDSDIIIAHAGNNGFFSETIRQIGLLDDHRIALENKPKIGILNEDCVGYSPDEFQRADASGILNGTVLDFVHAVCAANSLGIGRMEIIKDFMKFQPKVFHLSDGNASSEKDVHLNLGKGNLNIAEFVSFIPENGLVTIETPRNQLGGLENFVSDINFLRRII